MYLPLIFSSAFFCFINDKLSLQLYASMFIVICNNITGCLWWQFEAHWGVCIPFIVVAAHCAIPQTPRGEHRDSGKGFKKQVGNPKSYHVEGL